MSAITCRSAFRSTLRSTFRRTVSSLLFVTLPIGLISQAHAAEEKVSVMYAGSLVNVMEHSVGPAFSKATGIPYEGYAGGSNKLANEIKGKLRRADVFISASPTVNTSLIGAANGDWVSWYLTFAESPLVIGYSPKSKFAADWKTKRWDDVLATPGIRIGRTDPVLDPKGHFTVSLIEHASKVYGKPDLFKQVLGTPENPAQVMPEETLVGRLQSGQMDAGFFYSTETSDLKIPFVTLPAELKEKAQYTVTVLNRAPNEAGALRFVTWLLSPAGQALLKQHGIDVIVPKVTGDHAALPKPVADAVADAGTAHQ